MLFEVLYERKINLWLSKIIHNINVDSCVLKLEPVWPDWKLSTVSDMFGPLVRFCTI